MDHLAVCSVVVLTREAIKHVNYPSREEGGIFVCGCVCALKINSLIDSDKKKLEMLRVFFPQVCVCGDGEE